MAKTNNDDDLNKVGKVLLKGMEDHFDFKSPRLIPNPYGSAPVSYDKMIFLDEEKEKEWENLDESTKECCRNQLKETCSKMETKLAIELLCHVINDMSERIKKLEDEKNLNV